MQLRVADLARTTGDALLSAVRAQLRSQHGFPRGDGQHAPRDGQRAGRNTRLPPAFGVEAIHSPEQVAGQRPPAEGGGMPLACAGYGSLVTVTAAMGLAAASRALARLLPRNAAHQGGRQDT